jgi:hypothetical protein
LAARLAAILAAGLCWGSIAMAAADPAKLKISSTSKEGVILFRAPVLPAGYHLDFRRENGGGWSGYEPVFVDHRLGAAGPRFIAIKVKPGRWTLTGLSQQLRWSVCYWKDAPSFEVRAGHITYAGEWDGEQALARLREIVVRRGHTVSQGRQYFWYWEDGRPPLLRGADDPALRGEAEAFARANMPGAALPFADPRVATVQRAPRPGTRC